MSKFVSWVKGVATTQQWVDEALADVGEAAIAGVCSLRAKYPNALRGGGILTPVLDRICYENSQPLPPPPPEPQFQGGQCPGVMYRMRYYSLAAGANNDYGQLYVPSGASLNTDTAQYPGRVLSWYLECEGNTYTNIEEFKSTGKMFTSAYTFYFSCNDGSFTQIFSRTNNWGIQPVDFVRADGQPDTCGDPAPPEIPDPALDPDDLTDTVTVCATPADPSDQRCSDVVIEYEPTLDDNGDQCFTVEGKRYCFTPDGVVADEPGDSEGEPVDPPVEEPGDEEEDEIENLVAIKVSISLIPANETVLQSGQNLTKIYAGWVVFKEGNYHHPRQFIDFEENIFYAPENANGYVVYLKPGYTGTVTKVVESTN